MSAAARDGWRLVLDWDGTVTESDTLELVVQHFGDQSVFDDAEVGLRSGALTLKECMELEFSSVRASLDDVVAFLVANAKVRPGFRELVERYHPLVLSSSFEETIRPVLEREGVEVDLFANRVDARPDGWRPIWRYEAECATCSEHCKRALLPTGRVVYVGDGYADRCAALKADQVFATAGLAAYLDERGRPFEPFGDFFDVLRALAPTQA